MKNEVMKLLNQRVSLRRYQDRPISRADMDTILEGAMRAPTAGNMMLYSIIKVEDPQTKLALSKSCDHQPFIAKAPTVLIFCVDYQRWHDYYMLSGVKEELDHRQETYQAPQEGEFMLAAMDALIASAYANIAAESVGVGSCYIGDIIEHCEIHQELLNLPKWVKPVSMLTLGYYPERHKQPTSSRFAKEFIVFDEKYERLTHDQLETMFKERASKFSVNNKFQAKNFGQFNYFRKSGTEFAKEMTRSMKAMLEDWSN